jgi:hypothetical protein
VRDTFFFLIVCCFRNTSFYQTDLKELTTNQFIANFFLYQDDVKLIYWRWSKQLIKKICYKYEWISFTLVYLFIWTNSIHINKTIATARVETHGRQVSWLQYHRSGEEFLPSRFCLQYGWEPLVLNRDLSY